MPGVSDGDKEPQVSEVVRLSSVLESHCKKENVCLFSLA
jgi:hypothetical protein